jgi:hypothetical protein
MKGKSKGSVLNPEELSIGKLKTSTVMIITQKTSKALWLDKIYDSQNL